MKVYIDKDELLQKMSDILSIVERKTTMPILSHFLFEASKEGSYIYATDLEVAIREPITLLEVQEEGSICINGKKLYEIAREVEEDVTLESDSYDWIKVRSGKSIFRIACLNPDDYPMWPHIETDKTICLEASRIISMMERTIYCIGESDPRYALNGVLFHISGENKRLTMVGTDGHRLAVVSTNTEMTIGEESRVIIPRRAVGELKKFLASSEGDVTISIAENNMLFTIGERNLLTKLIDGPFPAYEQVIPANNDKILIVNREDLSRCMRRMAVISKEKSRAIKVEIADRTMSVSVNDPEVGEANDSIDVNYDGQGISIGFSAKYMLDAINTMESDRIVLEMLDTMNPTLIKEEGNDDYLCVIMPMRI